MAEALAPQKSFQPEVSYDSTRSATPASSDHGSDRDDLPPTTVQQDRLFSMVLEQFQHVRPTGVMSLGLQGGRSKDPTADGPIWITSYGVEVPPPPAPHVEQVLDLPTSLGSRGHPYSCGVPCKYLRRKGGCRNGSDCTKCHRCTWSRKATLEEVDQAKQTYTPMHVDLAPLSRDWGCATHLELGACRPGGVASAVDDKAPSVGTIGHPDSCAQACKYNGKSKGCKDGRFCVRCHLCVWRRCHQR